MTVCCRCSAVVNVSFSPQRPDGRISSIEGVARAKDSSRPAIPEVSSLKGNPKPSRRHGDVARRRKPVFISPQRCSGFSPLGSVLRLSVPLSGLFHVDFAWVLARTRASRSCVQKPSAAGANAKHLAVTDQTGCDGPIRTFKKQRLIKRPLGVAQALVVTHERNSVCQRVQKNKK